MTVDGNQMQPTAYACKKDLSFEERIPVTELKHRTDGFLSDLTGALRHRGCKLIGHIKGLIHADDNGHLLFSITSFEDRASFKGNMLDGIVKATITVNVIVYGIDQADVEETFEKLFGNHFGS